MLRILALERIRTRGHRPGPGQVNLGQRVPDRQGGEAAMCAVGENVKIRRVEPVLPGGEILRHQPHELVAHRLEIVSHRAAPVDQREVEIRGHTQILKLAIGSGAKLPERVHLIRVAAPEDGDVLHTFQSLDRGEERFVAHLLRPRFIECAIGACGIVVEVRPGRGPLRRVDALIPHQPVARRVDAGRGCSTYDHPRRRRLPRRSGGFGASGP